MAKNTYLNHPSIFSRTPLWGVKTHDEFYHVTHHVSDICALNGQGSVFSKKKVLVSWTQYPHNALREFLQMWSFELILNSQRWKVKVTETSENVFFIQMILIMCVTLDKQQCNQRVWVMEAGNHEQVILAQVDFVCNSQRYKSIWIELRWQRRQQKREMKSLQTTENYQQWTKRAAIINKTKPPLKLLSQ